MTTWAFTAYCGDENTQDECGTVEAPCLRSATEEVLLTLGAIIGHDQANACLYAGEVYIRESR